MSLILYGVILGIAIGLLWPGNPASRAVGSVTNGISGVLRSGPGQLY